MKPLMTLDSTLPKTDLVKYRIYAGAAAVADSELLKRPSYGCHPETWAALTDEQRVPFEVLDADEWRRNLSTRMNFDRRLGETIARFMAVTMQEPRRVYLGRMEDRELNAITEEMRPFMISDATLRGCRNEYRGLQVFVVDAATHLEVGL